MYFFAPGVLSVNVFLHFRASGHLMKRSSLHVSVWESTYTHVYMHERDSVSASPCSCMHAY